jgi:hypothetical protein
MDIRHCSIGLALAALGMLATGCRGEGPEANPAPTAESHQPETASPYGTGAQETRDHEEAQRAQSTNDDPDTPQDEGDNLPRR